MKAKTLTKVCDQILAANMAEYSDERIAKRTSARDLWILINGTISEKEEVLENYNIECLRVCEQCGELMDEGWMLDCTVVCSDECAARFFEESVDEFKYRMSDENFIRQAMEWDKCEKKYEDLTEEERGKYLDMAMERTDFYWTEWE